MKKAIDKNKYYIQNNVGFAKSYLVPFTYRQTG